jgi:hypothetical protein
VNGRTFNRTDWLASQEAWKSFGWQWQRIREAAAAKGFIYPPLGTAHDDRDADNPSQRAIVWRALNDNPTALYAIVGRSRSWSDVVDAIFGLEARLREDAGLSEKDAAFDKDREPTERDSASTIASMVERIIASRGLIGKCPKCGWSEPEPVREAAS